MGLTVWPATGRGLALGSRTANLQLNMRAAILLLVVLALAVDLSAAAKKKRPRKKFCPQEVGTDRCNAKQSQYKCGVFYKDLLKSRPLTYIGALPDDLTDKNKGSWQAILGPNAKKESFSNFDCDGDADRRANSRCYTIMNKLATSDLDSCEDSLLNHRGRGGATMGDTLCSQLFRFLSRIPKRKYDIWENGIKDQEITFQHIQEMVGVGDDHVDHGGHLDGVVHHRLHGEL